MISSFFWNVTQRRLVVIYRRFGTISRVHLLGPSSRKKFELLDPRRWARYIDPETSVNSYQSTLRKIPAKQRSHRRRRLAIFGPFFFSPYRATAEQCLKIRQSLRLTTPPVVTLRILSNVPFIVSLSKQTVAWKTCIRRASLDRGSAQEWQKCTLHN